MKTYKIIKDEKAFKEFIDWLPDTDKDEQFYFALFARKKYDSTGLLKSDKSQIARGTATKDRLFDKIKKLEVPFGSYKFNGKDIPQESLALYILPNPRCMRKSSLKTAKMILDNIDKGKVQNPKAIALNAIQTSKSKTYFVDFDLDHKDEYLIREWVQDRTGHEHYHKIVETRGGYHILIEPDKTNVKNWHQQISKNQYIDQKGDLLLPVVGCTQGGFVPKFI